MVIGSVLIIITLGVKEKFYQLLEILLNLWIIMLFLIGNLEKMMIGVDIEILFIILLTLWVILLKFNEFFPDGVKISIH